MASYKDDIDKYAEIWEKALADGIFEDAPKPSTKSNMDYFGNLNNDVENTVISECDSEYWNQVYNMSKNGGYGYAPDVIKEDMTPSKEELKMMQDKVANSANPVYPDTVGKDQDTKPTPNWTDGKELRELTELKRKLEALENEMNATEGMGKNSQNFQKKIDDMRQQFDDLSNNLTQQYRSDGANN